MRMPKRPKSGSVTVKSQRRKYREAPSTFKKSGVKLQPRKSDSSKWDLFWAFFDNNKEAGTAMRRILESGCHHRHVAQFLYHFAMSTSGDRYETMLQQRRDRGRRIERSLRAGIDGIKQAS